MKCKYCQAEIEEGFAFCPSCGKPLAEEEPATQQPEAEGTAAVEAPASEPAPAAEEAAGPEIKEGVKATPGKIAAAVIAVVVILAVLVALIVSGLNKGTVEQLSSTNAPTDGAEETVEVTEGTIPPDGNPDDVTCKGSYTVTDEEILAAADTVVATVDGQVLTNGQLQAYYWAEVLYFMQQYGDYAIYFGLDFSQPMDTQICDLGEETTMTWQQYFLECALENWHSYQALTLEGEANGYEPEQEFLDYLENLPQTLEDTALANGAESAADLISGVAGAGCSVEDYIEYLKIYNWGYMYFYDQYDKIAPTDEEVEAFFAENEEYYTESGITKDSGKYVDVRHVLLVPEDENATTGEDGYPVYSDDAWEACRVEAQALYDQWLAGDMTEDSFATLANENSADSDGTDGGLYTEVAEGYMVQTFNDWCFDAARQVGDHDLIKTQYGYHIMYFVGSQDIWFATAKADLIDNTVSALVPAAMEKHPAEIDYTAIALGLVDMGY